MIEFRIAVHVYRVRIVEDLMDLDDMPCNGRAVASTRELLIEKNQSVDSAWSEMLHEVLHCWDWHAGGAVDIESLCDLFATAGDSLLIDIERMGGRNRVRAMLAAMMGQKLQESGERMEMSTTVPVDIRTLKIALGELGYSSTRQENFIAEMRDRLSTLEDDNFEKFANHVLMVAKKRIDAMSGK